MFVFIGCSIASGTSLQVVSQSMKINTKGEFECRNNGVLFYANKTKVVSNQTKCLATAQWKDSDVVQCWTGVVLLVVIYNAMPGSFVGVASKCF